MTFEKQLENEALSWKIKDFYSRLSDLGPSALQDLLTRTSNLPILRHGFQAFTIDFTLSVLTR